MKLSLAFLTVAAPAVVSGNRLKKRARATALADADLSNVEVKASSKIGGKLLSKARRLDGDDDFTWIAGYSLKFHSCTTTQDYYGGYFNGNNDGDNGQGNYNYNYNGENGNANGNYYYGNREDYAGMYEQKFVHFKLCPSDSCWRCKNGADYVVELGDFAQAVLEAKMNAQEYNCEHVRENCNCDGAYSESGCYYNCYQNAGLDYCHDADYEDEFDLQDAMECAQLEVEDEDAVKNYIWANTERPQYNNGYYNANGNEQQQDEMNEIDGDLYVGPYCKGSKILLGVFLEETCSVEAPGGIYEATHYGDSLPFSTKSIVDTGCISCKEPKEVDYNNYWDNQDPDEATQVCTDLYEIAGKCEEGLDGYYPNRDVSGCAFISNLKSTSIISMPSNVTAKVFAIIFAVTTLVLAGIAVNLFKKNRRQNVSLAGEPIIS